MVRPIAQSHIKAKVTRPMKSNTLDSTYRRHTRTNSTAGVRKALKRFLDYQRKHKSVRKIDFYFFFDKCQLRWRHESRFTLVVFWPHCVCWMTATFPPAPFLAVPGICHKTLGRPSSWWMRSCKEPPWSETGFSPEETRGPHRAGRHHTPERKSCQSISLKRYMLYRSRNHSTYSTNWQTMIVNPKKKSLKMEKKWRQTDFLLSSAVSRAVLQCHIQSTTAHW